VPSSATGQNAPGMARFIYGLNSAVFDLSSRFEMLAALSASLMEVFLKSTPIERIPF
jgi:hypothetical protein